MRGYRQCRLDGSLDLRELRAALSRVLDAAEARFGATIELGADHYWTLDPRRTFEPSVEPFGGLMAGQLSDDVDEMQRVATRADHVVIWHDLAHIVGILARIVALDLPHDASP